MLHTYPATLTGDRLIWSGDAPQGLAPVGVPVHVTVLVIPPPPADRREQ